MIACRGNCGELVKLDDRPGWAATRVVVVWLILAALGPEFLSLDPKWAYNRTWRYGTPVDWITCLDLSMSYLVRAFHLAYALKMFWKVKEVHHTGMQQRLLEADSTGKPTSSCNKRFHVGERPSCDGGLKPFGVAHGIGQCEVKVVGGHHPAKTPCKGPGDGRHVWVKLCTPAMLNLF
jgi:hypothetical protein